MTGTEFHYDRTTTNCLGAEVHFTDEVPEGVGHEADWLTEVTLPLYGPPPQWRGWRVLAEAQRAVSSEFFEGRQVWTEVAYEVGLLHVALSEVPASLYVESTVHGGVSATRLRDRFRARARRKVSGSDAFDWEIRLDGERLPFRAVRVDGLAFATWTRDRRSVRVPANNWPTHEPLNLVTIPDLTPYMEEWQRLIDGFRRR